MGAEESTDTINSTVARSPPPRVGGEGGLVNNPMEAIHCDPLRVRLPHFGIQLRLKCDSFILVHPLPRWPKKKPGCSMVAIHVGIGGGGMEVGGHRVEGMTVGFLGLWRSILAHDTFPSTVPK